MSRNFISYWVGTCDNVHLELKYGISQLFWANVMVPGVFQITQGPYFTCRFLVPLLGVLMQVVGLRSWNVINKFS